MQIILRINGVFPDINLLGGEDNSERAAEVKNQNKFSNTSCSIFLKSETKLLFHLLVDIGQGVMQSIEKGFSNLGFKPSSSPNLQVIASSQYFPDALLITHAHDDHINEFPILIDKVISNSKNLSVFCTLECYNKITKKFPQLSNSNIQQHISFNIIQPNTTFNAGQFTVIPILAYHGNDIVGDGAVIYVIQIDDKKIIIGWDFLTLPEVDEHLLWNPDILILGTQNYNPHPETGMISVTDAYNLIRRWNAKECFIVHYSGLQDLEESKNQWFRGPTKPMIIDKLQKTINSSIPISGGRDFKITVAQEGLVYILENLEQDIQNLNSNLSIGEELIIESLQKYVVRFEKDNEKDKLKLMIEDRINRSDLSFDKPRKDQNYANIIHAEGEKGMMARGPKLTMGAS